MKHRAALLGGLVCGSIVAGGCGGTVSSEREENSATVASPCTTEERPPSATTRLFVPSPNTAAIEQIKSLTRQKRLPDAARLAKLVSIARAVWLVGGSPSEVKKSVRTTMRQAKLQRSVPVLVAYNLPYRDCSQYSSGGAVDTEEYQAWIDGLVAGIKNDRAIVILEPDGLGIIPYNTTIYGEQEWCRPTITDEAGSAVPAPGASPEERYAALRYAVAALAGKAPNAQVYLDGSHSSWLGVGEAAYRIHQAGAVDGVLEVRGFFLNVSNYRETSQLTRFGTWVSKCIAAATTGADWARDHFDWCPSQYNPDAGYAVDYSDAYAATVDVSLENMMQGAESGAAPWRAARWRVSWTAAGAASRRANRAANAAVEEQQDALDAAGASTDRGRYDAARDPSAGPGAGAAPTGAPHGRGRAGQRARAAAPLPRLPPAGRRASQVPHHRAGAADRVLLLVVSAAAPGAA